MWSHETGLAPDPQTALHVRERVERFLADATFAPHALVTSGALRPLLADFFERAGPSIAVYAFGEIPSSVRIDPVELLAMERAN